MNTQPEALRLADELTKPLALRRQFLPEAAAAELRRLQAINGELLEALKAMLEQFNYSTITGFVEEESEAITKARAALSKAGESA